MIKRLADLVPSTMVADIEGDPETAISGLSYDSRETSPGHLFFALPGTHVDGRTYIPAAIRAGAAAIAYEGALTAELTDAISAAVSEQADRKPPVLLRVSDARAAMSPAASSFYGQPSRHLAVIGVTGTEGKSTMVWLIYRLLDLAGKKAGFFSTVDRRVGDRVEPNPKHQTTPEATTVHDLLARMAHQGFRYAVVESSSHGLSPRTARLADVHFDAGVMTNVRHEHLEFHGTWEQYRHDKSNLFRALDAEVHSKTIAGEVVDVPSFGVVCIDDPSAAYFAGATTRPVYTYSARNPQSDLWATDAVTDERGSSFVLRSRDGFYMPARIELPGAFNIENAVGAVLAVHHLAGIPFDALVPLLPRLEPVLGRMTRIECGQPFEVIVDYAHTPSSFEAILPSVRQRIQGKVLCVFGSGGERDTAKRPEQGRIASRYCDVVVLSDEDPRGEDPVALLMDIAAGCENAEMGRNLLIIPDRARALRTVVSMAAPGDCVLLLGKGHESTIDYAGGSIPWDESAEARAALAEAGYSR